MEPPPGILRADSFFCKDCVIFCYLKIPSCYFQFFASLTSHVHVWVYPYDKFLEENLGVKGTWIFKFNDFCIFLCGASSSLCPVLACVSGSMSEASVLIQSGPHACISSLPIRALCFHVCKATHLSQLILSRNVSILAFLIFLYSY